MGRILLTSSLEQLNVAMSRILPTEPYVGTTHENIHAQYTTNAIPPQVVEDRNVADIDWQSRPTFGKGQARQGR